MVLPKTDPTKSFWIEAAESKLKNHRSTQELPDEVDVVIIGSGYTGATAAYWLHKVAYSIAYYVADISVHRTCCVSQPQHAHAGGEGHLRWCYWP